MFRSARHRSPIDPALGSRPDGGCLSGRSSRRRILGCGLDYVFRNISPLHVTGWSFAWPILPSQSQRLEEDMKREERDKVPDSRPDPGRVRRRRPALTLRARKRSGTRCPSSRTAAPSSMRPSGITSGS